MRDQSSSEQQTQSIRSLMVVRPSDAVACTIHLPNQNNDSVLHQSIQTMDAQRPAQNQFEINIFRQINITGLSNTPFRLDTQTSFIADNGQWIFTSAVPMSSSSEPLSAANIRPRSINFVSPSQFTSQRAMTPVESVEFFPKPVNQERRARQKQLLSQPIYESLPNSYERVHRLASDQSVVQAEATSVREDHASSSRALTQSMKEAYLSEHMLNRNRDELSLPNNTPQPTMFVQLLLTGSVGAVPYPISYPQNSSVLNQYFSIYLNNFGPSSGFDTMSMFPAPQVPQYRQYEPVVRATAPVPVSSTSNPYLSPSLVIQGRGAHEAQRVPQAANFVASIASGKPTKEVEFVPDFVKQQARLAAANPHLTALKTSAIHQTAPNVHNTPLVAARSVDHVVDHRKAVDQPQPTSVSQHTIQPNRNDPSYTGPWQNPATNIPTLPKTDAADIRVIPFEKLYSGILSEPQLVDPGGPPELGFDLDKGKLRAPMAINSLESPLPMSQRTIVEPPTQMSHPMLGVPIPDQRSNVISSSQSTVQTDRDIRNEKIPTQVEKISRIPPIKLNNTISDRIPSVAQELVFERFNGEIINPGANLGHQSAEMLLSAREVRSSTQSTAALDFPARKPFEVSETIDVLTPDDVKRLHETLSQPTSFFENVASSAQFTAKEISSNQEPYYSSLDRETSVNQQSEALHVDQAILPGQIRVGEKDGMFFAIDNPRSTGALLTTSDHFSVDPVSTAPSFSQDRLRIQPEASSLAQNTVSLKIGGPHASDGSLLFPDSSWDEGGIEIEPMPIQSLSSVPTAPSLNRGHSSDQIDDSEYATELSDQLPQPVDTNTLGSWASSRPQISTAEARPVSFGPMGHTEPIDSVGQMRVRPARTTDSLSSKVMVSDVISEGQVQGPSTQFHSSHVNEIPISTDTLLSRSKSVPPPPPSSTYNAAANTEKIMKMMMERMASHQGVGSDSTAIGECLPGHTSQIRITKESVNRRVEWDWKRDFIGNSQNQTPGQEVGWATMNDSYEIQREVHLYTDGFVPPFALGEHPQILINLNGEPGLQYDMDFGDSGNIRVGVRANGATTTSATNTTTTNNTMVLVERTTSEILAESAKSRLPTQGQSKFKIRCFPIRQWFPKKTASAMR